MKNILILAAHPDDETLGMGGTISRLSSEGHNIRVVTFTDGESSRGETYENRNPKLQEVSDILGISSFDYGDFPDNAMDSVSLLDLAKFIESNKEFDPDIIFTHNHSDLNIDHTLVYKATLTAFRPQFGKSVDIYSYFVPSATDYNPDNNFNGNNVYFKLSEYDVNRKMSALRVYDAEMRPYPHTRSYDNVKSLINVWGSEVGTQYAEKFKLIRSVR
ncbi:PIG-L family deacetylase [bacterium]|nr:PIG-L family deacetylase [bacterium]